MFEPQSLVQDFLSSRKVAGRRWRWRRNGDQAKAKIRLSVLGHEAIRGELRMVTHLYRIPEKHSFSVIFQGRRVMGLDVEPGRWHFNAATGERIGGTHWHRWPDHDVVPDGRNFIHSRWFYEFVKEANIVPPIRYLPPPGGVQLGMML